MRPEGYGDVTPSALLPGIFSGPAYRSIAAPSIWRNAAVTRAIRLLPRAAYMFGKLFRVLKSLVRRPLVERELDEEVRFHLEMEIEQHVRNGMSPDGARRQAYKDFGGFEQIKEECRDARGTRLIDNVWQDLRFGARTLAGRPGFSIAVIAVLALGIGANTAIFSAVNGVLLQPLDYEHGERLLLLRQ